jgi:serine/threonine-protein kinase
MQHVDGESLRDKIARRPLPLDQALAIAADLARGLAAAREQRIVHRDIKPGNILFTSKDQLKIADFGLAAMAVPASPGRELHPVLPLAPLSQDPQRS